MNLTTNDFDLIREIVGRIDPDARVINDYSGRAMYGRTCVGLIADNALSTFGRLLASLNGRKRNDIAAVLVQSEVRTDDMGLSEIAYWPSVTVVVDPEDEDRHCDTCRCHEEDN